MPAASTSSSSRSARCGSRGSASRPRCSSRPRWTTECPDVLVDETLLAGPVVVMFSGGRDSTALLHAALAVAPSVTALHVDHAIRPDSARDAEHCADIASQLGAPLIVER